MTRKIFLPNASKVILITLVTCFHISAKSQSLSAQQIIRKHFTQFNAPPSKTPGNVAVDAPLLGNGYAAAALAGPPEHQTYFLARNDFWRLKSGYNESFPAVLGKLQ